LVGVRLFRFPVSPCLAAKLVVIGRYEPRLPKRPRPLYPKHGGNPESDSAHIRVKGAKDLQYGMLLNALVANADEGLTEEELFTICGMLRQSTSARLAELKAMGLVLKRVVGPNGEYVRRKNISGSFAAALVPSAYVIDELS
jgi:hypothetical protein